MLPAGLEPATPAGERPQTHVLERAATGTGTPSIAPTKWTVLINKNIFFSPNATTCSYELSWSPLLAVAHEAQLRCPDGVRDDI